jgi:hypothetical protein
LSSVDFISQVVSFKVTERVDSQHMPVELELCSKSAGAENRQSDDPNNRPYKCEKMKWDPTKVHMILEHLTSEIGQCALEAATDSIEENAELALGQFVSLLTDAGQCMRRSIYGGVTQRSNKWFDSECRDLKKLVTRALSKYKRTRSDEDRLAYTTLRARYQKLIKLKKKEFYQSIQNSLLENKKDSSKFWNTIKQFKPSLKPRAEIDINTWKEHFEQILGQNEPQNELQSEPQDSNNNASLFDSEDINLDLDDDITIDEVKKAIRKLKSGKAPGLDEVSTDFLKATENIISPFLTKLFNHLFNTGTFPQDWCKSVIIPLFKKGDMNLPGNYRGISLLSCISKVFTSILNNRLYSWAEKEHKIGEEQAGFRKEHSTADHIFTLVSIIKKTLYNQRKSKLYAAFIDFQKAFDSVDRSSLWKVLHKVKTSRKMLCMLQGIYSSVQACVRWNNEVSDFFTCPKGVKQGCMLSPLIFSLLVNEIAEKVNLKGKHGVQFLPGLKEIFLLMFADDMVLISTSPSGLQNQINNLEKAATPLGLEVNAQKTKVMVFRKGGHLAKSEKWHYKGMKLEVVNKYKYLGFTLSTKLSFDIALEEYAGRAKWKILEIMKTMWRIGSNDYTVFFKLFDAQVKPMLLYASEVWGLTRFNTIESPHLFACKRFLRLHAKTPNTMVYGELGRYPLYIDSTIKAIKYWLKLQEVYLVRFCKQAYVMNRNKLMLNLEEKDQHNWAYNVKHCLDIFGFSHVWINGGVGNEKLFLREFKQRMIDCHKQDWNHKICSSERFDVYRSFKTLAHTEKYLFDITLQKFRTVFTKLRMGVININVNNRYNNASKNCPFCMIEENELHFLIYCPKYADLRQKYISKYFISLSSIFLKDLLQNENTIITRSVAMYTYYALKRREEAS